MKIFHFKIPDSHGRISTVAVKGKGRQSACMRLTGYRMTPAPSQIKAARQAAGHTQQQAAETVHRTDSARWREWESGRHKMDAAVWELYLIKTNQK